MRILIFVTTALALAACGDGAPADPLTGDVTGTFDGQPFTPTHGYAIAMEQPANGGVMVIRLGDAPIGCGTNFNQPPRPAVYGLIYPTKEQTGDLGATWVSLLGIGESGLQLRGSSGTLVITTLDEEVVAGTVDFDQKDDGQNTLKGSFEVRHCPGTTPLAL